MDVHLPVQLARVYHDAAQAVVAEYAPQPEVVAILLAGSVVRGEGGTNSDLDMWIIAEVPYRQRRSFVVGDVPVEIFLNPPAWTERYLAEDDAHAMHMVGYGWPLYIRGGAEAEVAAFQAHFRAAYERGPQPLSESAFAAARYGVIDLVFDVEDVLAGDPVSALLVMDRVLAAALNLYYARQRVWLPKWKRLLPELAARAPDLADAVTCYLTTAGAQARYAALREILTRILPEGFGLEQWAWESDRQPISE
jgi:hypothetical protein